MELLLLFLCCNKGYIRLCTFVPYFSSVMLLSGRKLIRLRIDFS